MSRRRTKKRRSWVPVLILILIVLVAALFLLPVDEYAARISASKNGYDITEEYDDLQDRYYYNQLNKKEKKAYRAIVAQLPDFPKKIYVAKLERDELDEVFQAVSYDNPEYFFLGTECSLTHYGKIYEFYPSYTLEKDEYYEQLSEVKKAAQEILEDVPDGADYEKELYLHDRLSVLSEYSSEADTIYTPYGMLVLHQANCEGYSRTFQWLLRQLGIQNRVITGTATSSEGTENHMWNVVTLDGQEYNVDVTWDDYRVKGALSNQMLTHIEPSHIYFNRSSKVMEDNHFPVSSDLWINCTDDSHNYFAEEGLLFDTYNTHVQNAIRSGIVNAVNGGATSFEIMFTTKSAFNKAEKGLMDREEIYEVIDWANRSLPSSRQVSATAIQYSMDEDFLTMRFFLL